MGLFDIFKKKDCEICGKEVGMLGYKKLQDGEICNACAKQLSWHKTLLPLQPHNCCRSIHIPAFRSPPRSAADRCKPDIGMY